MANKLKKRQEIFCVKYFELGNASEAARIAGYAPKWAGVNTHQLLGRASIQERLKELREKEEQTRRELEIESVMSVLERKQRLTEVARARLTDFMEMGKDGVWCNLGPETPMTAAIQEIKSSTEYDKDGDNHILHTSVKLHNPLNAIDLLNKMDKLYSDGYQDNRTINRVVNIYVIDTETKELISQVGERTKLIGNANNQSVQGCSSGVGRGEEGDTP